ncbi:unnamed protein product [Gongylonema pulchrum]|uniref:Uncharacterized protein n=1 Tax=Gongylonema pulchrum TaxID=637853 RepID=A0A183DXW8_9BILA|nr:unnamed protein product [Gongylonema pulchrum]
MDGSDAMAVRRYPTTAQSLLVKYTGERGKKEGSREAWTVGLPSRKRDAVNEGRLLLVVWTKQEELMYAS